MKNFNFKVNPKDCLYESDAEVLFRALELSDGDYLISWISNSGGLAEIFMSSKDVFESVVEKSWIILEK